MDTSTPTENHQRWAQWRAKYRGRLIDLGDKEGPQFSSIFSPGYDTAEIRRFMTKHYGSREGAEGQAKTLDMYDSNYSNILRALAAVDFGRMNEPLDVLEIGAGFGAATVPLLDLLPNAFLCTTEFSVPMLVCLKERIEKTPHEDRCVLVQANAEELDFVDASFDVILGAAILHHLFKPDAALAHCARMLKPGGVAIFFEPFEEGMDIVKLIFKTFLRDPRSYLMRRRVRSYMQSTVNYWQRMMSPDKVALFEGADDKWIFPRQYFLRFAKQAGLECSIFPMSQPDRPFELLVKNHTSGNGFHNLPQWFWEIVNDFENSFSDEVKVDLITEGVVVLKKPVG